MASDTPTYWSGAKASADLSDYLYYLVKRTQSTVNQVEVCDGASDVPIGSLYDKPDAAAEPALVAAFVPGTVIKVKVGAAGATAGWVGTDGSGLLVTKVADQDFCIGRIDTSYSSGDLAEVWCMPGYFATT